MSFQLSRAEFETCLLKFFHESVHCSTELKWTLETKSAILKQSYLKRQSCIVIPLRHSDPDSVLLDVSISDEEQDESVHQGTQLTEAVDLEHHVAYSTSYQVPVLYLRASFADGTPLSHDEIYQYVVPSIYQDVVLTQNEHPVLGIPCWYIHPCDTRILMSTIEFDLQDYIKVWLSVYGPMVKCSISTQMFV